MITTRIEELAPKIKAMTHVFAQSTLETEEDLYQEFVLHLLERQAKDSTFGDQNDSYILDAGRKRVCYPSLRNKRYFERFFIEELEGDYDSDTILENLPDNDADPEQAVISYENLLAIAGAIRTLSRREKEVVSLILSGVRPSQIAAQWGTTPVAVSVYRRRAQEKILASLSEGL